MKKFICLFLCVFFITFSGGCKSEKSETTSYDLSVTLNENMTATCVLNLNYVNSTKKKIENLTFNLYPNAFSKESLIKPIHLSLVDKAFENGISYGSISILCVKQGNTPLKYSVESGQKHLLKVELNGGVNSGESALITIEFNLTLPNVNHRYGYGQNTVNLTGFYPILCPLENGVYYESVYYPSGDPFYSEVANYSVSLTVPSSYVVASSLSAKSVCVEGANTTYNYQRNSVREVAFVLSKNFNVIKKEVNGVQVYYYYFNDLTAEKSLETACKALSFFSTKFARYPYNEYVFCEADFIYGGMEYPCLTMIDKDLTNFDRHYVIVHETAHQWWYGLVGVNQSENAFIDEGLTEFSTVTFFNNFSEYKTSGKDLLKRAYNAYYEIRKNLSKEGSVTPKMNANLGEFKSDLDYVSIAYYRAQLTFNELKNFMGDMRFNKFLKNLCSEYAYKNVSLNNFLLCAEKHKKGAKKFLLEYIDGSKPLKSVG